MTIRWGVIGATSRIYRRSLRPAFEFSDEHEIVAEASRNGDDESPYVELLARDDVDAVYIPLPNTGHKPWILAALDAGKHVLCEKPLTLSAGDTDTVFAAAKAANRVVLEAYMWPHHPRARRVLDLVADGELGELRSIHSVFTYATTDLSDHRFDERGAGALFDVGIYCLGPALLATQRDPVGAMATAIRNDLHVDVSMTGFVDWGEGVGSSFDVSFEEPARRLLEITGTEGVLTMPGYHAPGPEEPSQIHILLRDDTQRTIEVPGANAFVGMVDHFAAVVDERERPVFGQPESCRLARLIDALHAAAP
jgi:D-xylose 1-dehydrogenase (NADP+, D-xylono-1,5-lactone-forming)